MKVSAHTSVCTSLPLSCCSICYVCVYALYDFHASLTLFISPSLSIYVCIFASRPVHAAMQQVLDNLGELPTSTGAKDIDLLFLRGIMESPIVRSLAKVAHTHGSG